MNQKYDINQLEKYSAPDEWFNIPKALKIWQLKKQRENIKYRHVELLISILQNMNERPALYNMKIQDGYILNCNIKKLLNVLRIEPTQAHKTYIRNMLNLLEKDGWIERKNINDLKFNTDLYYRTLKENYDGDNWKYSIYYSVNAYALENHIKTDVQYMIMQLYVLTRATATGYGLPTGHIADKLLREDVMKGLWTQNEIKTMVEAISERGDNLIKTGKTNDKKTVELNDDGEFRTRRPIRLNAKRFVEIVKKYQRVELEDNITYQDDAELVELIQELRNSTTEQKTENKTIYTKDDLRRIANKDKNVKLVDGLRKPDKISEFLEDDWAERYKKLPDRLDEQYEDERDDLQAELAYKIERILSLKTLEQFKNEGFIKPGDELRFDKYADPRLDLYDQDPLLRARIYAVNKTQNDYWFKYGATF